MSGKNAGDRSLSTCEKRELELAIKRCETEGGLTKDHLSIIIKTYQSTSLLTFFKSTHKSSMIQSIEAFTASLPPGVLSRDSLNKLSDILERPQSISRITSLVEMARSSDLSDSKGTSSIRELIHGLVKRELHKQDSEMPKENVFHQYDSEAYYLNSLYTFTSKILASIVAGSAVVTAAAACKDFEESKGLVILVSMILFTAIFMNSMLKGLKDSEKDYRSSLVGSPSL